MVKCLLIKQTQEIVSYIDLGINDIKNNIDDISEDIDYYDIIDINIDKNDISKSITCGLAKYLGNGKVCNCDYISIDGLNFYQMFFIVTPFGKTPRNKLASQMTNGINVDSDMIIFKTKIYSSEFTDVNPFDLNFILTERFIKKGIKLLTNGSSEEYNFVNTHLDHIYKSYGPKYVQENYEYEVVNICNFQVYVTENKNIAKENNNINQIGSKICGKNMYGDLYIALVSSPQENFNTYFSLDKNLFEKMIAVVDNKKTGSLIKTTNSVIPIDIINNIPQFVFNFV